MLGDALNCERKCLLHQTIRLELVAVRQAPDERSFPLPVHTQMTNVGLGPTQALPFNLHTLNVILRFIVYLFGRCSPSVSRAFLLRFAIQKEVAEDTTRAPEEAIRPSFDPALVFVENENGTGSDHFSFGIDQASRHTWYDAAPGSLEDQQRIPRRLYPSRPRRFRPRSRLLLLTSATSVVASRHRSQ